MKYLYLILITVFISCSSNNHSNEQEVKYTDIVEIESKSIETSSEVVCENPSLFKEKLTLPLEINNDFFTMFENVGEKISIPYECVNNGKVELYEGLPMNIYYAYGKAKLNDGKDYYLVIEAINPENPVDLFYVAAILFSNNKGVLENGIEIAKYHAYSGVQEYYDGQLNKDGTINQHIKKIGNDGISESVFEERDTSFSIIK